jgi:soluble lytic murein transglycosylase-like protein
MPSRVARWGSYIDEAGQRFGVPVDWIVAVMVAESGGETMRNGRPITSHAGAMGLMQVMPATWAAMRDRYGLGDDPHDPRDNILAGTAYLRLMYERFGYPGVFGAYNAGPGRYADHLASGKPLPAETRAYVARLADRPATPAMPPATLSGERLFFTLGNAKPASRTPENGTDAPPPPGLFVPLTGVPRRER